MTDGLRGPWAQFENHWMNVCFQDVDFDAQSQSSYDRALSERGHSQMSSDDTWKGKSNTRE